MSCRTATLALAFSIPMAMVTLCGLADEKGSAIDRCAEIGISEQRIRCLEDLVRELSGIAPSAPDTTAEAPAAIAGTADVPAATAGDEVPRPSAAPGLEAAAVHGETEPGMTLPVQEREEPNPASVVETFTIDDMGSEQLPNPDGAETEDPDIRFTVEVVDFDFVGRNKLRMRLVNGQVWRQIDADRSDFQAMLRNKEGFVVELWKTALGGYRMRILPTSKTVRVQRLK